MIENMEKEKTKCRIKKINDKYYIERKSKGLFNKNWTIKWPSTFILGEWRGPLVSYEFDTHEDCMKFLENRKVTYIECFEI